MFTTQICVIIHCDECKQPIQAGSDDYEGHPHFDSEAEALSALGWDPDDEEELAETSNRGWLDGYQLAADTLPDRPAGQILCYNCLIPPVCAARGHRWDEWFYCRCSINAAGEPCPPRMPLHAGGCPEIRRCKRHHCCEREERMPASTEHTAEATV